MALFNTKTNKCIQKYLSQGCSPKEILKTMDLPEKNLEKVMKIQRLMATRLRFKESAIKWKEKHKKESPPKSRNKTQKAKKKKSSKSKNEVWKEKIEKVESSESENKVEIEKEKIEKVEQSMSKNEVEMEMRETIKKEESPESKDEAQKGEKKIMSVNEVGKKVVQRNLFDDVELKSDVREFEDAMVEWLQNQKELEDITLFYILEKAELLASEILVDSKKEFKVSESWFKFFRKRRKLEIKYAEELEMIESRKLRRLREKNAKPDFVWGECDGCDGTDCPVHEWGSLKRMLPNKSVRDKSRVNKTISMIRGKVIKNNCDMSETKKSIEDCARTSKNNVSQEINTSWRTEIPDLQSSLLQQNISNQVNTSLTTENPALQSLLLKQNLCAEVNTSLTTENPTVHISSLKQNFSNQIDTHLSTDNPALQSSSLKQNVCTEMNTSLTTENPAVHISLLKQYVAKQINTSFPTENPALQSALLKANVSKQINTSLKTKNPTLQSSLLKQNVSTVDSSPLTTQNPSLTKNTQIPTNTGELTLINKQNKLLKLTPVKPIFKILRSPDIPLETIKATEVPSIEITQTATGVRNTVTITNDEVNFDCSDTESDSSNFVIAEDDDEEMEMDVDDAVVKAEETLISFGPGVTEKMEDITVVEIEEIQTLESENEKTVVLTDTENCENITLTETENCENITLTRVENSGKEILTEIKRCENEIFKRTKNEENVFLMGNESCENPTLTGTDNGENAVLTGTKNCENVTLPGTENYETINLTDTETRENEIFVEIENCENEILTRSENCVNNERKRKADDRQVVAVITLDSDDSDSGINESANMLKEAYDLFEKGLSIIEKYDLFTKRKQTFHSGLKKLLTLYKLPELKKK